MWRLAGYVYRAFRNTAAHRCSQDAIIPSASVCNNDDDDSKQSEEETTFDEQKFHSYYALKHNQYSNRSLEGLEERLRKIYFAHLANSFINAIKRHIARRNAERSIPEVQSSPSPVQRSTPEETLESLLQTDQACVNTLQNLSDLQANTASIINNELAIDALEAGNYELGVAKLQASIKNGRNAPALFNLAICYERGIGVEQDRAKACDYYRQASALGHLGAQFNLSLLSNHIDIYDSDNEDEEISDITKNQPPVTVKLQVSSPAVRFSQSFANDDEQYPSTNDYHFNLNRTIACL